MRVNDLRDKKDKKGEDIGTEIDFELTRDDIENLQLYFEEGDEIDIEEFRNRILYYKLGYGVVINKDLVIRKASEIPEEEKEEVNNKLENELGIKAEFVDESEVESNKKSKEELEKKSEEMSEMQSDEKIEEESNEDSKEDSEKKS